MAFTPFILCSFCPLFEAPKYNSASVMSEIKQFFVAYSFYVFSNSVLIFEKINTDISI